MKYGKLKTLCAYCWDVCDLSSYNPACPVCHRPAHGKCSDMRLYADPDKREVPGPRESETNQDIVCLDCGEDDE